MIKNVILGMLVAMTVESCAVSSEAIVPSDNYITQKVKVEKFDGISTATDVDVVYTQATGEPDVEIYAPDNLMGYIRVEVKGDMLKIRFESDEKGKGLNIRGEHKTQVRVSSPAVHALQASSSSEILLANGLKTNGRVSVESSSAADIEGEGISCEDLLVQASSSGEVDLKKVECVLLDTDACSAGEVDIKALKAEKVDVDASSSGDISLEGVCRSASFDASSAGDIEADALKADEVDANASSAGDISCYAVESLKMSSSSGGSVNYKGSPKQIIKR